VGDALHFPRTIVALSSPLNAKLSVMSRPFTINEDSPTQDKCSRWAKWANVAVCLVDRTQASGMNRPTFLQQQKFRQGEEIARVPEGAEAEEDEDEGSMNLMGPSTRARTRKRMLFGRSRSSPSSSLWTRVCFDADFTFDRSMLRPDLHESIF
jgi:hypothetical protein